MVAGGCGDVSIRFNSAGNKHRCIPDPIPPCEMQGIMDENADQGAHAYF